ncbi:MAG: imidazole glycerol phosphate synthase, glutamine amidotransferase subunit [Paludibacter sp. 47-17]|jgi:glutamine amidotransferase|nr:MAG: imidazole glycerol phosphate synthase, glutamine amidotransferase subunit [Paludibacter sp. 47-17]
MITIIDYGLGNIRAFQRVFEHLKVEVSIATCADDLVSATKLILPGVGAFDYAMTCLNHSGMRELLEKKVLSEKIPVLGVCVGMQMLASKSDEGVLPGLGWIEGSVKRFNPETIPFKTRFPHMGWNSVIPVNHSPLMNGIQSDSRFYFLHSYYFEAVHPGHTIATTIYGAKFCSAVQRENIFGVQFHPEKSHSNGVKLLHNFANL